MPKPETTNCAVGGEKILLHKGVEFKGLTICLRHYERFKDWAHEKWKKLNYPPTFKEYLETVSVDDYLEEASQGRAVFNKVAINFALIIAAAVAVSLLFLPEELRTAESLFRAMGRLVFLLRFGLIAAIVGVVVLTISWYVFSESRKTK